MTWRKKPRSKSTRWLQAAIIGLTLVCCAIVALRILGLPFSVVTEHSEVRGERQPVMTQVDAGDSKFEVRWGE